MRIPDLCWRSLQKLLLASGLICVAEGVFGQNDPATEASSSSAASSKAPEKPIYASPSERDSTLLANTLIALSKAEEIQWIETPDDKVLAIYKLSEKRKTKGVLLILHAPETPQRWPAPLETIRRHLPLYGWGTMTTPLPARYPSSAPAREFSSAASSAAADPAAAPAADPNAAPVSSAASSAASSEPAKPLPPRDQVIASRTQAAIAQLNKLGQFNLVIMVDNSSAPFALPELYKKINKASTTAETIDGPLQALILMNMQDQEPLNNEELKAIFSVPELPIMDVFFSPDDQQLAEHRRNHQAIAMRQNVKDYQQVVLSPESQQQLTDPQGFWLGKVHGFMERKAEGNELKSTGGDTLKAMQ